MDQPSKADKTKVGAVHVRWHLKPPGREDLVEVDVIVTTRDLWEKRPDAIDDSWSPKDIGPHLVAIRVLF